jgi:lysyl-tRNA synthetase class 1
VPIELIDPEAGIIRFTDPATGEATEQSILSGGAKLQWKVDWAMRWVALGVDYEMSGKDLIDSVIQSSKIARVLGARPPEGFNYELFLDENGEKISKTKGNGVTIDEWLTYAPETSLSFYIYREPKRAKQLSFGIIPKAVDEYQQFLAAYPGQAWKERLGNPVHHVHAGQVPPARLPLSFALLLNLVGVASTDDKGLLWAFVKRYAPEASPETHPELDALIGYAVVYFRDFVKDSLRRRAPTPEEADALRELDRRLAALPTMHAPRIIRTRSTRSGKSRFGKGQSARLVQDALRDPARHCPRPSNGEFHCLYGLSNSRKLIAEAVQLGEGQRCRGER